MARKVLSPAGDGKAIGMYSPGFEVDAGRLVFVAGQVAIDGTGQVVGENDVAAQAAQVFRNLEAVLGESGCTLRDVVKFTTFLTRSQDFAPFTEYRKAAYPRLFPDGVYPPNTGVVVSALARPELLIEIEAIAVTPRAAARAGRARAARSGQRVARSKAGQGRRRR
jgi:enamine deaminase RidA (YjgF/YER057c/UK114 family)